MLGPKGWHSRGFIPHYDDGRSPGHGSCVLRDPKNAQTVLDVWAHSDGDHYRLHAWVAMPNHIHVLVEPLLDYAIGDIVGAWKSVSARKILATENGRDPKKCHLWQLDYYDRFIRNERHYRAAVDYIHQNPVKASLVTEAEDWPWSSAAIWDRDRPRSP